MARSRRERSLTAQLRMMLDMAGADPKRWIIGTVAASLVLAALDTIGVAAMVPLTQLITGDTDSWFVEWLSQVLGTTELSTLIPVVAAFITVVFILKSIGAIVFRWWLLGRTTRISALSSAELARRYALAPYSDHRSRRISEVYRNINDATGQSSSVLLGVVSIISDALVLVAITGVLAITSPAVTLFAVVLFGVLVFGVQLLLRRRQYRVGEELAAAGLEAWQFLLPGLDGFREARLTSSANAFIDGFRRGEDEARQGGAGHGHPLRCAAVPARDRVRGRDHGHLRDPVHHGHSRRGADGAGRVRRRVPPRTAGDEPHLRQPRHHANRSGGARHRLERRRRARGRRRARRTTAQHGALLRRHRAARAELPVPRLG